MEVDTVKTAPETVVSGCVLSPVGVHMIQDHATRDVKLAGENRTVLRVCQVYTAERRYCVEYTLSIICV